MIFTLLWLKEVLGIDPNEVLAFITGILVIITAIYAYQTKKTVDAINAANKLQFRPIVKPSIVTPGPVDVELQITNVGKGPAQELYVTLSLKENPNVNRVWMQSLLSANDQRKFLIPVNENEVKSGIDYFKNNQNTLIVECRYHGIQDDMYEHTDSLDITQYVTQYERIISLFEEESDRRVARNTEQIASAIKDISKGITKSNEINEHRARNEKILFQEKNILEFIDDSSGIEDSMKTQIKLLVKQIVQQMLAGKYPLYVNGVTALVNELNQLNVPVIVKMKELIPELRRFE